MSSDQAPPVLLERAEGVARVTLNRPGARNALNLPMCVALREAFESIDRDDDVRVVVVEGAGTTFCAGADLKERKGRDEAWVRQRRLAAFAAYEAIERCSRPVIAVLRGPAVGSGGEIAMCCDFVIATEIASFRFPEPSWGTVGATQRLQRVIGKRRAKELLFTGRLLESEEAYAWGLIARRVSASTVDDVLRETVRTVSAAPALALRLTKQCVDLGEEADLATGIRIELAAIERCLAEGGWRRGVDAFAQHMTSDRDDQDR